MKKRTKEFAKKVIKLFLPEEVERVEELFNEG